MTIKRSLSLATKIKASLLAIALVLLGSNLTLSFIDEKALSDTLLKDKLESLAVNYFDAVNTMMLTGTMGNKALLEQKVLSQPNILQAKILRGDQVIKLYGPGQDNQAPQDAFEEAGLAGEQRYREVAGEGGNQMEFVLPLRAGTEHLGSACLGCHQAQEGEVLGAVKISYDLASIEQSIRDSLAKTALFQLLTTLLCFLLLYLTLNKLVLSRLRRLKSTIYSVEQELDLSREIKVHHADELGAVSLALNSMLSKFKASFESISTSSQSLVQASREVDQIASLTKEAVLTQKSGTLTVAAAINQLDASANEVKQSTENAAAKSDDANAQALSGLTLVDNTQRGIVKLRDQVQQSTEMINTLNDKTIQIGSILEMITSIADQTNLLALNASIEAARAGEHGRGFSVVADEVRVLATRTREAIEQIQQTIDGLQGESRQAVAFMEQSNTLAAEKAQEVVDVAGLLQQISAQIGEIDELNNQIANAAQQQNQAADEINENVVKISDVADQSSEDAVKGTQISEQLLQLACELQDQVQKFKL
ncbi:MAG: methyl-accepting chemotaxis protein [Pseudomonadales bacterium]